MLWFLLRIFASLLIFFVPLFIGWFLLWKLYLNQFKFMRDLLGMNPKKPRTRGRTLYAEDAIDDVVPVKST